MIRFELKLRTPSLNKWYSGQHWAKRKEKVDLWHDEVEKECKGIEPPPYYPISITTQSYFKDKRQLDTSNTFTANKLVEDGLVKAGILPADTPGYVAEHSVLRPEFDCKENKVVVWLDMLEDKRNRLGVKAEEYKGDIWNTKRLY